jgi:hypothetical protein
MAMSGDEEQEPMVWHYYTRCPLEFQCSKSAWAKVDADTDPLNLKAKLRHHLMSSSLHSETVKGMDIEELISSTEVQQHCEDPRPCPQPKTKQRTNQGGASSSGNGGITPQMLQSMISQAVQGRDGPPTQLVSQQPASRAGPLGTTVVRKTQLQQAVDCVGRAATAASHAQRLAASAAAAFGEEHANLQSARDTLLALFHKD